MAKRANNSTSSVNVRNEEDLANDLEDGVGHALDNPQNLEVPLDSNQVEPFWPDYLEEANSESEEQESSNNMENNSDVQGALFYSSNQENSEQVYQIKNNLAF